MTKSNLVLKEERNENLRKQVSIYLVAKSCQIFATPWTAKSQDLSVGFPRQEYWRGLPIPSPGDLPNPGMEPTSPALAGRFFTTELPGKPKI